MAKTLHIPSTYEGKPHVLIASLLGDGRASGVQVGSLVKSLPVLIKEGIAFDYYSVSENCHVDDARNDVLRQFMQTQCTDLLFIDDDVGWEPEAISRILKYDRDVVAGVYPKRTPDDSEEYPVRMEPGKEIWAEADGLVEVVGAPTGFMRIRRNVIEKMIAANKNRQYLGQKDKPGDPPYTIVFERTFEKGHRHSGDYSFCNKWRDLGGKIYVDPEMFFCHEGNKEWTGCLGDFWRKTNGVTESQSLARAKEAVARLQAGESDIQHVADIAEWWGNKEWASGIGMAMACLLLSRNTKGRQILECGSGLSTIIMATSGADVHSLEHDPIWADRTICALKSLGLSATVHYSPIRNHGEYRWYESWPKLDNIGLLLCDGPPRLIGREGLSLIADRLTKAVMVWDDAASTGTVAMIERWEKETGRRFIIMNGDRAYAVSAPVEERMSAA